MSAVNKKTSVKIQQEQFLTILTVNQLGSERQPKQSLPDNFLLKSKKNTLQLTIMDPPQLNTRQISFDENKFIFEQALEGESLRGRPKPVRQDTVKLKPQSVAIAKRAEMAQRDVVKTISISFKDDLVPRKNFRISNQLIQQRVTSANQKQLDKRNVFNSFHVRTIVDGEGNKTAMMAETTQNRLHLELNQEDFEDVSVRTESRLATSPAPAPPRTNWFRTTDPFNVVNRFDYKPEDLSFTHQSGNKFCQNIPEVKENDIRFKQMDAEYMNITDFPEARIKIECSGQRQLTGKTSLIIIRQSLIIKGGQNWWKSKEYVAISQQVKGFINHFRKTSATCLLLHHRQKSEIIPQALIDSFDIVASLVPLDHTNYFNRVRQDLQFTYNLHPIIEAMNHNKLTNIYILENANMRDQWNHNALQHRIPRIVPEPKDFISFHVLFIPEKDTLPDLVKQECQNLQYFISSIIAKHRENSTAYPEVQIICQPKGLQQFFFNDNLQYARRCLQRIIRREVLMKRIDQAKQKAKQLNRQEQQVVDQPYAAEKKAELFRDQMVDKLKGSKQKITNMYFIVGDVVQRNIKLFRAQENEPFLKEPRHRLTLERIYQEIRNFEESELLPGQLSSRLFDSNGVHQRNSIADDKRLPNQRYPIETNARYFAMQIPDSFYKT